MKIRWDPKRQRFPSLSGKFMVDTYRGQLRVRAWPRKRGPSKSKAVREQNAWFKAVNQLAKIVEPTQQNMAIAMAKGTGLYPRDLLLKQMAGGMYDLVLEDGRLLTARRFFRETVVFQGAILEQDTAQTIPLSATTPLTFPVPVLDTAGFWNAANPTRLTIPAGIEVVEFTMGWRGQTNVGISMSIPLLLRNGVSIGRQEVRSSGAPATIFVRGPLTVAPGDFFEFALFLNKANLTFGDLRTFFTLNVLQAA